jgi:hypothetical protein
MAYRTDRARVAVVLAVGAALGACHHAVPVTGALATPPIESLSLVLPVNEAESVRQLRRAIYEAGLQTTAQHEAERWVRVDMGSDQTDESLVRQWHAFLRYDPMPWGRTMISLRAVEMRTHLMKSERTGSRVAARSQMVMVSDQSTGLAQQAWQRLELIAAELVEAGAESLSETGPRTATIRR